MRPASGCPGLTAGVVAVSRPPALDRQGLVQVRSRGEQRLDRADLAFAGGKQQRGKASGRTRADVRPTLDQRPDDGGMAFRRRPHQRGLSAPAFLHVHVRSVSEQHVHGIDLPRARGRHQDRFAFRQHRVRVGPGLQEHLDAGGVPVHAGQPERRHAVAIRRLDVCSGADQQVHQFRIISVRRPVEGGRAVGLRGIHVDALLQQGANGRLVRRLDGVDQRARLRRPRQQWQATAAAPLPDAELSGASFVTPRFVDAFIQARRGGSQVRVYRPASSVRR